MSISGVTPGSPFQPENLPDIAGPKIRDMMVGLVNFLNMNLQAPISNPTDLTEVAELLKKAEQVINPIIAGS